MNRTIVLLAVAVMTGAATAANIWWQGPAGDQLQGGNWKDASNWKDGTIPGAADGAWFSADMDGAKITLTEDLTIGTLNIPYGSSDANGEPRPMLFYGPNQRLTLNQFSFIYASKEKSKHLYFDLKELYLAKLFVDNGGRNIVFLNGLVFHNTTNLVYQTDGSSSESYGIVYFNGATVFDTSGGYPMTLDNITPYGDMSLATRGSETVSLKFDSTATRLAATTLEAGSKLVMRGRLNTRTLTLAAGATLSLTAGVSHVELGASIAKDKDATIDFSVPADLEAGVYPVFTGPPGNDYVEQYKDLVTLSGEGKDSATLTNVNGSVAIITGEQSHTYVKGYDCEWKGTAREAEWYSQGNWYCADYTYYYPGADNQAVNTYLYGLDTFVFNLNPGYYNYPRLYTINIPGTCGPVTLQNSGEKTIDLVSSDYSMIKGGRFPAVLSFKATKSNAVFGINTSGSYVEYSGTASCDTNKTSLCPNGTGDVRLSGTFVGKAVTVSGSLTVLNGGKATMANSEVGNLLTHSCYCTILEGGSLEILAGRTGQRDKITNAKSTFRRYQRIDGKFLVRGTLVEGANQHYYGTGTFELAHTASHSEHDAHIGIAGGLTLIPAEWSTVSSDNSARFIALLVEGDATLGAKSDWRYGVATNVAATTTAPDNRAIRVCEWATLTVDTEHPDTGAAQTITLDDPIRCYGPLVKKGAGTLLLAATNNVFREAVTLKGGDLAWSTNNAPTFASLAFDGGAIAPAVDGEGAIAPAVVKSNTDISRMKVSLAKADLPVEWTTVLKTTGGALITGKPWLRHCEVRVVAGTDGYECQICKSRGFVLFVK